MKVRKMAMNIGLRFFIVYNWSTLKQVHKIINKKDEENITIFAEKFEKRQDGLIFPIFYSIKMVVC